jgi:hypothetical protein
MELNMRYSSTLQNSIISKIATVSVSTQAAFLDSQGMQLRSKSYHFSISGKGLQRGRNLPQSF